MKTKKPMTREPIRRLLYVFDETTAKLLDKLQKQFGAKSVGETFILIINLTSSLQEQACQGYNEIVARNPKTGQERVMNSRRLIAGFKSKKPKP